MIPLSRPWKIILFSLAVAGVFVYWNFRSHYDPFWHKAVGFEDVKDVKPTQTVKAEEKFQLPFQLLLGLHYTADYNVTDLVPASVPSVGRGGRPMGAKKFNYFTCEPPKCIIVSNHPRITYLPHFLSDEECDEIIKEAKPKIVRSEVAVYKDHKAGESPVQEVRTSTQAWLDPSSSQTVANIRARLTDLTSLNEGELLQVLHYGIGQKYDAHNDYFDPVFYGPQATNRAITQFLYLNTVEEGGETWFPRANNGPHPHDYVSCNNGLRVRPVKGTMVLFYDMNEDGFLDPLTLHGACPVVKGEKWGGTQWLRVPTPAA